MKFTVRAEDKVKLLALNRFQCPRCHHFRDRIKILEERAVMAPRDFSLPILIEMEFYRSPRGAIGPLSIPKEAFIWDLSQGSDPRWCNYQGWNEIAGRIGFIFPPKAEIAMVRDRRELDENFVLPSLIRYHSQQRQILLSDMYPFIPEGLEIEERWHISCYAEALLSDGAEKVGEQGNLEIFSFIYNDSPLPVVTNSLNQRRIFLNHTLLRGEPLKFSCSDIDEELIASQREDYLYAFIKAWEGEEIQFESPDHGSIKISIPEIEYQYLLLRHPVPRDKQVD